MEIIINKVKESELIQLDLADFKPSNEIIGIDLSYQLWKGLVLKEKDFRFWIQTEDWSKYKDKAVYIFCSVDAIIPTWAFMLVASSLQSFAYKSVVGTKLDLEKQLILDAINKLHLFDLQSKKIIIKGCSDISCPEFAMVSLVNHLQPYVASIMYGEPCSTVPIYKNKRRLLQNR